MLNKFYIQTHSQTKLFVLLVWLAGGAAAEPTGAQLAAVLIAGILLQYLVALVDGLFMGVQRLNVLALELIKPVDVQLL